MKKLLLVLSALLIIAICFSSGIVFANETGITLIGEDELEDFNLETPAKRIETVYKQGEKVFIKCSEPLLVPVGKGDSMYPMVSKGHMILATKDFEPSEIQVGDFIVVDNLTGRYFHQVVEIKDSDKGLVFTTRGINNTEDDIFPVFSDDIIGVAIAVIW